LPTLQLILSEHQCRSKLCSSATCTLAYFYHYVSDSQSTNTASYTARASETQLNKFSSIFYKNSSLLLLLCKWKPKLKVEQQCCKHCSLLYQCQSHCKKNSFTKTPAYFCHYISCTKVEQQRCKHCSLICQNASATAEQKFYGTDT
jgi:hypothetical protein